jgi:pyruvate/2-oxoglutarate dehydrogenase complex dihydrolipoamide dehydrogenase (E3) component
MTIERYQNVVIGSGEAGKFLGWNLAKQGQRTVIVERSLVGGACPNVACLPSKNIIHSAKVFWYSQRAAHYGVATGEAKIDMAGVIRRKREMIEGLKQLHDTMFQQSGAELMLGEARFSEPKTVLVTTSNGDSRILRGDRVFLAVGTRASLPDVPGLADAKPMTHVEMLNLERLPNHLVILGGGYVGLEFAQAMRRFGAQVTVVERGQRLLTREDADVSEAIQQLFKDEGIEVLLETEVVGVTGRSGESVQIDVRTAGVAKKLGASDILAATGRTPNTDRLAAEKGGVQLDQRGYIRVNERLETTAPDVWAMGECAGSPAFTHISFDDHRIVRDNLAGGARTTRDRLIPYCLFTDPELVHVGLSEYEAKAKGVNYRVSKIPMASIIGTRPHGENRGFVKALIGEDDRIVGFTALGHQASELLAAVEVTMLGGLPYTILRDGVFPHPTIAEGFATLFANPPGAAS